MFLAIVLITLGLSFLALNLGFVSVSTFNVLWPLLLIFFGVYVMMKGGKGLHDSLLNKPKRK